MAAKAKFSDRVFINCSFDKDYWPLFEAVVFTVLDCGFVPRCALDEPDSGNARIGRIKSLIRSSRYAIHDISRIELTPKYPRFNMPFEVGIDLGCRMFGNSTMKHKRCLIMEAKPYRYQKYFSDIAGQDIKAHYNVPDKVVTIVRDWLKGASRRKNIPGPQTIRKDFANFIDVLPRMCKLNGLDRRRLLFADYITQGSVFLEAKGEARQ